MALQFRTGGSRHTGTAALPHKNIQEVRDLAGEYLVLTHDDDIMEPTMLEKEIEVLLEDESVSMSSCNVRIIDSSGRKVNFLFTENNGRTVFRQNELLKTFASNSWDVRPAYPSIMYRTSILRMIDFTFFNYVGRGDDLYLMFSINKLPKNIIVLHECLYQYRVHEKQDSINSTACLVSAFEYSIPLLKKCISEDEYIFRVRSFKKKIDDSVKNEVVRKNVADYNISKMLDVYVSCLSKQMVNLELQNVIWFMKKICYLKEKNNLMSFEYIIWGTSGGGDKTKYLLDMLMPNSKCIMYLDSFKNGIPICNINDFSFDNKNYIFICGGVAEKLEEKGYHLLENFMYGQGVI